MENKKLTITILSDSCLIPTGYRNQSVLLAQYLRSKGHTIHYLNNAYNGMPFKKVELMDGTTFDWINYGEMLHSYFMNTISEHLKKTQSDILYIQLDTFMLYPALLDKDLSPAKSVFHTPSDGGGGLPKGCELILKKIDYPIAMSKFCQKQVKDYYNMDIDYIPLATESKRFYRLPDADREQIRAKWGMKDKFVIGVVARNQPRKMLDRTLKMMYHLKDKIPNAVLFMHMDPYDPAGQMFNMFSMIQRYGLENRVVFSGMKAHSGFDWNQMNEVYNVMDVFYLSTSGEGFGIPLVEAMACEIPCVATDYTTTQELIVDTKAGLGARLSGTEEVDMFKTTSQEYDLAKLNGVMCGSWEVERGMVDVKHSSEQIFKIYSNPELAKQMGKNGRRAVLENYDFNTHVGPKMEAIFYDLCK